MIVKVLGLKQLGKKLAKLEDSTITEMAMDKACQVIENDAKVRCPVDDGQLRQSITHEVLDGGLTGVVGTNVEYAPQIYMRRVNRTKSEKAKLKYHTIFGGIKNAK